MIKNVIPINSGSLVDGQFIKYDSTNNVFTCSAIDLSFTGSYTTTESFELFTQSYYTDSQSFDSRINGITNYIDISYNNLTESILNGALGKGQYYYINDYQTKYLMPYTDEIHSGSIEPLMVLAIETNSIHTIAYSSIYHQDIIHYDWSLDSCEDGTWDASSMKYIGGTPRTGKITYRKDTNRNISTYYDWRNVKFRRWKITGSIWDSDTEYNLGSVVEYNDVLYKYLKTVSGSDYEPSVNTLTSIPIIDFTMPEFSNRYLSYTSSFTSQLTFPGYILYGIYIDANDYQDYYTFTLLTDLNNNLGYDTASGFGFYNCELINLQSNKYYSNTILQNYNPYNAANVYNFRIINDMNSIYISSEGNNTFEITNGLGNIFSRFSNVSINGSICDLNLMLSLFNFISNGDFRYNLINASDAVIINGPCENNNFYELLNCNFHYGASSNIVCDGICNGIVSLGEFRNNTFYNIDSCHFLGDVAYNNLPIYISNLKVLNSFQNNSITESLSVIANIQNCIFGKFEYNYFSNNTIYIINEKHNGEFSYNTMSISNIEGNNFNGNIIDNKFDGNYLKYNTIYNNLSCCTCSNFQYNIIMTDVTSSDFSSASHVTEGYLTEIFSRSGSVVPRLRYYDDNDTLHFTDITA